jgi:hypothetical protein
MVKKRKPPAFREAVDRPKPTSPLTVAQAIVAMLKGYTGGMNNWGALTPADIIDYIERGDWKNFTNVKTCQCAKGVSCQMQAGVFVRHDIATNKEVLDALRQEGRRLQSEYNERTKNMSRSCACTYCSWWAPSKDVKKLCVKCGRYK